MTQSNLPAELVDAADGSPIHPGYYLSDQYIKRFQLVPAELAKRLGVNPSTLSRLINQEADLTAEMAVKLSGVLGVDASSLLYMQAEYDLWRARMKMNICDFQPICMTQPDMTGDLLDKKDIK